MKNLSVTIIQANLLWEDPKGNMAHFDDLLSSLKRSATDCIILPEMFSTGFTMQPEKNAEEKEGMAWQWMKERSQALNCVLTGSICVKEDGKFYNRLYWFEPGGNYQYYNKRHLFRMGAEHTHYMQGDKKIKTVLHDWNIVPLVCYDLRFPVWSRNRWEMHGNELRADYDILIYVANWPQQRIYAWRQLLVARAIENQCYVIGVNRTGTDGNQILHSGESLVIDPLGKIINQWKTGEEQVETVILDHEFLSDLRKKFPVGMDTDPFILS